MFGALRALWTPKPPATVEATYIALVAAARNPFFYTSLGVPDSIDGRFEMIVLHLFLLQQRLLFEGDISTEQRTAYERFCQSLSEAFFADLDANLREMGVADTGVSHRIKKMGKAYHGRLQVYRAALEDGEALRAALARNLYGTVAEGDVEMLGRMADYIRQMRAQLAQTKSETIVSSQLVWPDAAALGI